MNCQDEIWKPIQGYEGRYEISSHGNVKSLPNKTRRNTRILKAVFDKDGYRTISLLKNKSLKKFRVCRLVAIHFAKRIDGKDFVDHINGVKSDDRSENLRWCTIKENNTFDIAMERRRLGINQPNVKEVMRKTHLGRKRSSITKERISKALTGIKRREDTKLKLSKIHTGIDCKKTRKPILMTDINDTPICVFESSKEASAVVGISCSYISSCANGRINSRKNFKFIFI